MTTDPVSDETERDDCELTSYGEMVEVIENLPFLVREKRRERRLTARVAALEAGISASTLTRMDQGLSCSVEGLIALLRWMDR
jgi:hypothetical protein